MGIDVFGNPCVLMSITDVQPAGGFLPAGSVVTVAGTGFQPETQVQIDGVAIASASWVDSSHIEIVTADDTRLDGRTVSAGNPDGTGATFVPYVGATDLGPSANALIAATETIFPADARSSAVFSSASAGTFFGLAFENPDVADSVVSIELWDAGAVVASASIALPSRTRVARDVAELFPDVAAAGAGLLQITATVPVQMMGLSGNETDGSVAPVLPALTSP
jgi:hypothetical protein